MKKKLNHIKTDQKNSPSPNANKKTSPFIFSKPEIKRYSSNGSFKASPQNIKIPLKTQHMAPKLTYPLPIKSMPFLPKYMGVNESRRMAGKVYKK